MKKLFFLFCFMAGLTGLNAQTLSQSFLFDFGPTTGTNGDITSGADANGKYWNNIANGSGGSSVAAGVAFTALVNTASTASTYALTTTVAGFVPNGLLNGALRTPYASQFTAGGSDTDLAIATATEDYWYTATASPAFKISGLNPAKRYKFKIFGSRTGDVLKTSRYTIVGAATTVGTLNSSNTAASASYGTVYSLTTGYNVNTNNGYQLTSGGSYTLSTVYTGNNCNTYVSDYLTPLNVSGSGEFTLTLSTAITGQNAYMNCMKMDEYKGNQTITFGSLPTKAIGDADYAPGATASSGLVVSYASSNTAVATIISGQIHIVGAGTTTITASQAGDASYEAATSVDQTLNVSASLTTQTITFGALSAKTTGDAPFDLTATASSGLTVSYASSNTAVATVSGSTVSIVGGGTTDITASQSGNGTYAAATNVIQALTVNKQNQTITFGSLSSNTDADAPFTVSPSSSSGLAVTLTSSNTAVALVSGSAITIVGAGSSTITASQPGNTVFNAASSVPQTLTVSSVMSLNQNLFFDFGPMEGTNGDATTNPDAKGNYWNNISNAAGGTGWSPTYPPFTNLINSGNANSGFTLAFTSGTFSSNGKLNGALLTPFASQFGNNSELAIATATEDYIFTSATSNGPVITFSGLNPSKKYKFKIFGSRNSATDRATQYTLQGAGSPSVGALQSSSAVGLGGTVYIGQKVNYTTNNNVLYALTPTDTLTKAVTYYGNNSTVYASGLVQPDGTGAISLTTICTTPLSLNAYINCLKIEEYANNMTTADFRSVSSETKVYPTNFSNQISVEGAVSGIEIYNALGILIIKQKVIGKSVINTSELGKGIYVLVVDGNKSYKLIK
ncbi:MAG: T9SS type A sorting domain-containing protein [Paludibacter sp.]